jgi:hypothetical protein
VRATARSASISEAINRVNLFRAKQWLAVRNDRDLLAITKQIINSELYNLAIGEGRKLITDALATPNKPEASLQLQIKVFLENVLRKAGLHLTPTSIVREPQALDGKRPDFVITYSNYGPLIVELKLGQNGDLKGRDLASNKSFKNLARYMKDYSAKHGVFLVVTDSEKNQVSQKAREKIDSAAATIAGAQVIYFNLSVDQPDQEKDNQKKRRKKTPHITPPTTPQTS